MWFFPLFLLLIVEIAGLKRQHSPPKQRGCLYWHGKQQFYIPGVCPPPSPINTKLCAYFLSLFWCANLAYAAATAALPDNPFNPFGLQLFKSFQHQQHHQNYMSEREKEIELMWVFLDLRSILLIKIFIPTNHWLLYIFSLVKGQPHHLYLTLHGCPTKFVTLHL